MDVKGLYTKMTVGKLSGAIKSLVHDDIKVASTCILWCIFFFLCVNHAKSGLFTI